MPRIVIISSSENTIMPLRAAALVFVVPLSPFTFLGPDGEPVDTEADALRLTCYPAPLLREQVQIRMREHEQAGGLKAWQDLTDTRDRLLDVVRAQVMKLAWPDGQPKAANHVEQQAQDEAFRQAWIRNESPQLRQWGELNAMHDRIAFLAAWPCLLVSPAEWKNLDERDLTPGVLLAIQTAFARATEEGRKGKQKPSG